MVFYAIAPLVAAIIPAAASLISGLVSSLSGANATRKANEQQFQQNMVMAGQERGWALEDFKMQNDYNSPSAQMARLKSAGLNPMLAYGSMGNMPAATVRSTDIKPAEVKPVNPTAGIAAAANNAIGTFMDARSQQMQQDANDRAQAMLFANLSNKNADTLYKIAQTGKLGVDTGISQVKLLNQQNLIDSQLSVAAANVQKTGVQTSSIYDANERQNAMYATNLEEAVTRIALNRRKAALAGQQSQTEGAKRGLMSSQVDLNAARGEDIASSVNLRSMSVQQIQERINQMKKDGTIKDFEIKLNQMGATKGDNAFMRAVQQLVNEIGNSYKSGRDQDIQRDRTRKHGATGRY